MKFSIVMPVFNGAAFIEAALYSILLQDYPAIEIIVVDGQSTDGTVALVEKLMLQYPSIRLISEKDQGQSDALNKGFRLATGDILAWHNADDLYCLDTFQTVSQAFAQKPAIDLVYGNYQLIKNDGEVICNVYPIQWNEWLFKHGRFCPVQPTVFWRRQLYERVGELNLDLYYCMDVDFYARAVVSGAKFYRIPALLGKFRVHQQSKTQDKSNETELFEEYHAVLSKNFNYQWYNTIMLNFFQLRAKLARKIKTEWLPLRK
jgi:glycosyltransferase involved in cell wall biosynthesis